LKIKPGQASNSELRYTNMGDERMIGAPSDIVFELIEIEDKTFERRINNLFTDLHITLEEVKNFIISGNLRIQKSY
jgi:DnaJ-class molecular chaperone